MNCPSCETSYPDGVKGCSQCQLEFHWEHKEETLPIKDLNANTPNREVRLNSRLSKHFEETEQEGWQVEGPADWESLQAAQRIEKVKGSMGGGPPIEQYRSVTVELKRLHPVPSQTEGCIPDESVPEVTADTPSNQPRTG